MIAVNASTVTSAELDRLAGLDGEVVGLRQRAHQAVRRHAGEDRHIALDLVNDRRIEFLAAARGQDLGTHVLRVDLDDGGIDLHGYTWYTGAPPAASGAAPAGNRQPATGFTDTMGA